MITISVDYTNYSLNFISESDHKPGAQTQTYTA